MTNQTLAQSVMTETFYTYVDAACFHKYITEDCGGMASKVIHSTRWEGDSVQYKVRFSVPAGRYERVFNNYCDASCWYTFIKARGHKVTSPDDGWNSKSDSWKVYWTVADQRAAGSVECLGGGNRDDI